MFVLVVVEIDPIRQLTSGKKQTQRLTLSCDCESDSGTLRVCACSAEAPLRPPLRPRCWARAQRSALTRCG